MVSDSNISGAIPSFQYRFLEWTFTVKFITDGFTSLTDVPEMFGYSTVFNILKPSGHVMHHQFLLLSSSFCGLPVANAPGCTTA
jgi:hypothetical protein